MISRPARGTLLLALATTLPATLAAQDPYVVHELAPGVFAAVAPPGTRPALFANSLVVVGDSGVLVVDSGQRPAFADALLALIRARTDVPVRWVVNTHWHADHVWGNATFREAFPDVRLIATPATRDSVRGSSERQRREQLERLRDAPAAHIAELEALRIVAPETIVERKVAIDVGGRTVHLLPLGPAHTPGDLVAWLSAERILAAGDLLEEGELWLDGADRDGWRRAVTHLRALDPAITLAAHGAVDRTGALIAAATAQLAR